jgi:hypothetical protein
LHRPCSVPPLFHPQASSASTRTCPGRGPLDTIPGSVYRELPRGRRGAREPPPGLPLAPPTSPFQVTPCTARAASLLSSTRRHLRPLPGLVPGADLLTSTLALSTGSFLVAGGTLVSRRRAYLLLRRLRRSRSRTALPVQRPSFLPPAGSLGLYPDMSRARTS